MTALCPAIFFQIPGFVFPGQHKSSLRKHEAPVRPNWIRHFLKQLHANMTEQLFAVVENPAAPWARADPKPFFHP